MFAEIGVADGSDEAIATAGNRFDVPGFVGIVSKRVANLPYAEVDAAFKVHEGVVAPNVALKLLPGDDLTGALRKQQEDAEGLWMDFQGESGFAQFSVRGVQFEFAETDRRGRLGR